MNIDKALAKLDERIDSDWMPGSSCNPVSLSVLREILLCLKDEDEDGLIRLNNWVIPKIEDIERRLGEFDKFKKSYDDCKDLIDRAMKECSKEPSHDEGKMQYQQTCQLCGERLHAGQCIVLNKPSPEKQAELKRIATDSVFGGESPFIKALDGKQATHTKADGKGGRDNYCSDARAYFSGDSCTWCEKPAKVEPCQNCIALKKQIELMREEYTKHNLIQHTIKMVDATKVEQTRPIDPRMAVIQDMCEEDTAIRKMAEPFIGKMEAQGDKYGVPVLREVVEALIKYFQNPSSKVQDNG